MDGKEYISGANSKGHVGLAAIYISKDTNDIQACRVTNISSDIQCEIHVYVEPDYILKVEIDRLFVVQSKSTL